MKKVMLLTLFCCGMMLCASEARHLYMCRKCEAVAVKAGRPDILYCPAKGSHNWLDLGRAGNNIYLCRKCRKLMAECCRLPVRRNRFRNSSKIKKNNPK